MPTFHFGLLRLLAASGLFVLATFNSARAQEPPVDPNFQDIPLSEKAHDQLQPVAPLALPEVGYENCGPAQAAWHPPIYYPSPEIYCPTGVVCRDWLREHTVGFAVNRRQRMLEKDYAWRVQNGHQPVCCPPHSCWGHKCEECPGVGCREGWNCFGSSCEESCAPCGNGCGINQGCQVLGDESSAIEHQDAGIQLAEYVPANHEAEGIQLVSDQRWSGQSGSSIETAGYCTVSDGCTTGRCAAGNCWNGHCWNGNGRHCRWCLHGGRWGWWPCHFCPLHRKWCFDDDCDECDDDDCFCHFCCLKKCLFADGAGGWRREIPPFCHYYMAYPVNPYHFDQRDGRIYAAQGYGHPVGVPLAPNVEHTYNYGWGLPSSRLTPVSRMPGAPGVANPPGVAGPGIFPPAFPSPITGGWAQ